MRVKNKNTGKTYEVVKVEKFGILDNDMSEVEVVEK